ncbi:MAG: IS200/IS605 family transposase [Ktedonobacteraceae bacterium]|nr:IS200/IS605 family transposase [Ktedonobacteraceae bacterium]
MSETYRSNNNVYYSCHYHVVWCPKYRRKVLTDGIGERLKQLIGEGCQQYDARIEGLEVMPDHVHLLVNVDPQFGIHRLVKALKGRSSRILRQEYPSLCTRMPTLWTNSYLVATTGGAPIEVIKHYIQEQKRV